jgi:hypothetical protein
MRAGRRLVVSLAAALMLPMRRLLPAIPVLLLAGAAAAEVVDIRQGTNLALAISPDKQTLAVDLLGGLWTLPATGGGATLLMPPGSGVAQPRFDTAGERIVFQRWLDGQWDLWLLTLADGSNNPLTGTAFDEREPEFTPDGRGVVFAGNRTGAYSIWSLDLVTGELRQLTDEPGDSRFPSYSETGELAYAHRLGTRSSIEMYSGGPRGDRLIDSDRRLDAPSWRPGGGVILFNERTDGVSSDLAMYVEADEPIRRPLTEGEDVFVSRLAWLSPAEYLYTADGQIWRRGIASRERMPVHLIAAVPIEPATASTTASDLDAPGPHRAAGINGLVRDPATGRIAFSALGDLWLVDGDEVQRLTDDAAIDAWPDFAPDGEWLHFASDRGGDMEIWRLRLSTGQLLQVTTESGRSYLPRVSADGRFVGFLETTGFGPWDSVNLRLIALDQPFASTLLASGLVDAGDLRWQGSRLSLLARDGDSGDRVTRVFDTAAAGLAAAAAAEPVVLDLPEDAWPGYQAAAADQPFVIQAARIFDGFGDSYDYLVDIHIEGQRIRDVVRRGMLPLPERVIDANELTVLPGLIDVHTHIDIVAGGEAGRLLLSHGVTTVRAVLADAPAAIELAETWAAGHSPGPRLVIDPAGGAGEFGLPSLSPIVVDGAHMARPLAHGLAEQRAQDGEDSSLLPSVLLVRQSEALPTLVVSTLGRSYQDVIGLLDASGRWLPTSLVAAGLTASQSPIADLSTTLSRVMRSSGRVAIGSDAPAVPYGAGFHDELDLLASRDVPNDQILRWATSGGAIALGLTLDAGTIEPGRLADLVIVEGDPLADIGDLRRIVAVVRGGVWLDVDAINAAE